MSRNKQAGMSLVELMIASFLGVLITMAIINIFTITNRTASQSDGLSQAQETGRFVASFLSDAISVSGYSGDQTTTPLAPHAELCADPNNPDACTINRNNGVGDRITVQRRISEGNDLDCAGSSLGLGAGVDDDVVDAYWVEGNGIDTGDLYCLTYDAATKTPYGNRTKQPIASGVIAIHALYGFSEDYTQTGNRNVTKYIAADEVPPVGTPDWRRVFSVKIAALVQSFEDSAIVERERKFILLDANPYVLTDKFSREVFTTTITRANFVNIDPTK